MEKYTDQTASRAALIELADLDKTTRAKITARAVDLVEKIRADSNPGMMEVFLAEYGLSTQEGIALMCLAEALLRVPDADTIDALIEDKIAPSNWGKHLGKSASSMVNASTWALLLTGKVLTDPQPNLAGKLRGAIKRLGEPVIRNAVARAMREMGRQFVLGETITSAMKRAEILENRSYTYSYDMLGEAALTEADARRYFLAYSKAITSIAAGCVHDDIRKNPGISVKLSALHPRFEVAQKARVMDVLVPRVRALAGLAKAAGMGFNIDAEEADRLALSFDVIKQVLQDPSLAGWDGFGVVVQAYGPRATQAINELYALATRLDRRIMIRLVKGAYWDTEIKHSQVIGVDGFPVFTSKATTDISYIANARRLLQLTDRIYPQFATHNAHTVAAILEMANDPHSFEFQRLHGMGEQLHSIVLTREHTRCRIYAPVGAHKDLLAYLVRRLLENGANSSFVNQIVDKNVPPEIVVADPFEAEISTRIPTAARLFSPGRINSKGYDLSDAPTLDSIEKARGAFQKTRFSSGPIIAKETRPCDQTPVINPSNPDDPVGAVTHSTFRTIQTALDAAKPWNAPVKTRVQILNRAADLLEQDFGALYALLAREAGKTLGDAVGELREAVDFIRYYAAQAPHHKNPPVGIFTCISPWNFPLAIFLGQISAALSVGNAVLAKPAEQTPLIAARAVQALHKAGVPRSALALLPGDGTVGAKLTSDPRVGGVCFTGSTGTALKIRRAMAQHLAPGAPFIAETGGINAMIIDSSALPEQAIKDVIESAFQSAGQRCSALRCLYVQEDIYDTTLAMLKGAMDELHMGNPWEISSDLGPLIDQTAYDQISAYVADAARQGRLIKQNNAPEIGHFLAPALIQINGISDIDHEVFGPVLHIAPFHSGALDQIIDDINATGYGLTFGLHTRIDDRVQHVVDRIHAGNIYVNRNQIGAVVGAQPFGGEGLSGTGPKAGGALYLTRFVRPDTPPHNPPSKGVQTLPGPTGESNRLSLLSRAPMLCLGPGLKLANQQLAAVTDLGGHARLAVEMTPKELAREPDISGALFWGPDDKARAFELALANRKGAIIPLVTGHPIGADVLLERHVCIDTTASGGNAQLLASV